MSSLHIARTLLDQAIRSNPSFVNRDARAPGQVVEREGEGKDVESEPHNEEIEEFPRAVTDTAYAMSSSLNVHDLTHTIV